MNAMNATAAPLRSPSGESGGHGWIFAMAGLIALGVACGVSLAAGELQAFYVALSVIVGIAVMIDFRVGAFLLVLVLPFGNTSYFPHSLFGVTGLNPTNLLLGATLISALVHRKMARIAPRQLLWLFVAPILSAGVMGMRHVDEIAPYFMESGLMHCSWARWRAPSRASSSARWACTPTTSAGSSPAAMR